MNAGKKTLKTVFDLHIPHLSCYALTVEEKTILATQIKQKKSNAPSDELMAQQFTILVESMKLHGYTHYEISNFCKEPHFARHNTNYWKGIPYLGIGAAAHTFDGIKRYWNISNNTVYANSILNNKPARESEVLSTTDAYNEYVMTSIRTIFGTDTSKIKQDFGVEYVQHFLVEISPFIENNWVIKSDTIYTLNDSGKLFCDYITENLFLSNEE
jgi:oxygen-independent coproporphyrinogen-3 oxidase